MKKFYFITLAFILLLTGCFGGNTTETSVEKEISKVEQTKQDGVSNASSGTVLELKQKHGTNQDKAIMPMYNVDYDKEFSFSFKADLGDLNFYDVISVHTDSKVLEESQLYTLISTDSFMAGPTTLTIKPSTAILASNSTNRGFDGWGNAPVYYIKVSYDLDTDTPTKLDEPIVIPFTVKSDVKVPNLNYEIDLEGKLKLVWDEFEGATSYNVYQIARWTDETNSELRSAEIGYLGLFPQLVGTTTETEFNDWLSDGTSGLTFVDEDLILYQNHGLQGEYFVTALMDDKESNFSSPVNTAPLSKKLPRNLISNIGLTRHKNINTLPRTTQVEMLDGTVSEMNIIYDVDGATGDNDNLKVKFSVQGTALREYIWLENVSKDDLIALKERNPENTTSARIEPKNEIDHVPAPEVPTVISLEPTQGSGSKNEPSNDDSTIDTLVKEQKENTEQIVEKANEDKVPVASNDIHLNVDDAFEEYLALHLLVGNNSISLGAFPESQNFETITDKLMKVIYQNPLILGVDAWGYDYNSLTLDIEYNESVEQIKQKQDEIITEAKKIVSQIIQDGMSDEEKRMAIYNYLADNTEYDHDALKAAEAINFQGRLDSKYNDSFTTYGILVKKVGVCMSYAYSYKLLSDLAGIDSIVVTGVANGVPHAWNKVKIGTEWLHVDVTNNEKALGFHLLLNSNDSSALGVNSILDTDFWVSAEISQFIGVDNSNDYYVKNGLEVSTMGDYQSKLIQELNAGKSIIAIRYTGLIDQDLLVDTVGTAIQQISPEKLETTRFGSMGNYIVVITE